MGEVGVSERKTPQRSPLPSSWTRDGTAACSHRAAGGSGRLPSARPVGELVCEKQGQSGRTGGGMGPEHRARTSGQKKGPEKWNRNGRTLVADLFKPFAASRALAEFPDEVVALGPAHRLLRPRIIVAPTEHSPRKAHVATVGRHGPREIRLLWRLLDKVALALGHAGLGEESGEVVHAQLSRLGPRRSLDPDHLTAEGDHIRISGEDNINLALMERPRHLPI